MHSAPLGVHTRCHIVPVNVTTHKELDHHDPEQAGEGQGKGKQVHQEADTNELPEGRGYEELTDFRKGDKPQKAN